MNGTKVLVIGYGNPGRGDDGLGPALATRLEMLAIPGVTVEADYQLSIEHAALAAEHDVVVFADAATDAEGPFYLRPITAAAGDACSSHSVTPGQVLFLARRCFSATPRSFVLGIRATSLDRFEEGLSSGAEEGLASALEHLIAFLGENPRGNGEI